MQFLTMFVSGTIGTFLGVFLSFYLESQRKKRLKRDMFGAYVLHVIKTINKLQVLTTKQSQQKQLLSKESNIPEEPFHPYHILSNQMTYSGSVVNSLSEVYQEYENVVTLFRNLKEDDLSDQNKCDHINAISERMGVLLWNLRNVYLGNNYKYDEELLRTKIRQVREKDSIKPFFS